MSAQAKLIRQFNSSKFKVEELRYLVEKFDHYLPSSSRKKDLAEILAFDLLSDTVRVKSRRKYEDRGDSCSSVDGLPGVSYCQPGIDFGQPYYSYNLNIGQILPGSEKTYYFQSSNSLPSKFNDMVNYLLGTAKNWVTNNSFSSGTTLKDQTYTVSDELYKMDVQIEQWGADYYVNIIRSYPYIE